MPSEKIFEEPIVTSASIDNMRCEVTLRVTGAEIPGHPEAFDGDFKKMTDALMECRTQNKTFTLTVYVADVRLGPGEFS